MRGDACVERKKIKTDPVSPHSIHTHTHQQARAQPFLVFGLLCTGLAIGHHNAGL
jgi:hypothetical protein